MPNHYAPDPFNTRFDTNNRTDMGSRTTPGIRPTNEYGDLQRLVNELYARGPSQAVSRMDVIIRAEVDDLSADLIEVVELLPAGSYKRARLCDQLNSIITAHGWAYAYGTVE